MNNKDNNLVQVKEIQNGELECFSFALPKGQLKAKHVSAFLMFLSQNEMSEVNKTLLNIYFTAIADKFFEMGDDEKLCLEHTLKLLADLTCERVCLI